MAYCGVTFTEEKRDFEIFGTVGPAKDFDAEADAKVLYKAMKGIGTDQKPITAIVSQRSTKQLKKVASQFQTMFGKDLQKWLKSELSGNYEKVVLGRFYGRYEYQAYILRTAMKGVGTNEQALIDVICSKTSEEMKKVTKAYKDLYERDLIKDIQRETSGDLGRILVSCATANRETKPVDNDEAKSEAKMLYDAGEGKWGTDERIFNQIFAHRSPEQLKLTFLYYRKLSSNIIFDAIEKEMSGKLKSAFLTIAQYLSDPITYYSEVMFHSMKGLGTSDKRLIRTIVARCEIDMKTIKERYNKLHETPLEKRIKQETRGHYEKILLALVRD